ncbi:MAG: fructosamine kinase family protein [Trueperaceae bacterium]|nr:fructosamine kinase family protein [Trueperaceae bacterium]
MSNGGSLEAAVAEALGASVTASEALSGGMIGAVRRVSLSDGRRVVAKTSPGGGLEVEAFMLRTLAASSPLPVPAVLHASDDLLVLEELPGRPGVRSDAAQAHLAELLAETHAVEGPAFGLERNTLLGPFELPNGWMEDGVAFFRERRLRWALGLAAESGHLPKGLQGEIEGVAARLPELLGDYAPRPVLLHGDLWSGNVLSDGERVTGVLDPAVHYGDAETELAFIDLFGGVGQAFWRRYDGLAGVPEAFWAWRRALWQLVPLLVHVALFGGGYVGPLRARVQQVVRAS